MVISFESIPACDEVLDTLVSHSSTAQHDNESKSASLLISNYLHAGIYFTHHMNKTISAVQEARQ